MDQNKTQRQHGVLIMIRILLLFVRMLLALRYKITIKGLDLITKDNQKPLLFLPNHPALIDPVILIAWLWPTFQFRPLADEKQIKRPFINYIAKALGVITIPDATHERRSATMMIQSTLETLAEKLNTGENILLYPAGGIKTSRFENIGGRSGAEKLARECENARMILVKTEGLWGSSFSRASGNEPSILRTFLKSIWQILASFVFFVPKRHVSIQLTETSDIPRTSGRVVFNQYLEKFYNQDAQPRTYVPYTFWEGVKPKTLPEPMQKLDHESLVRVPADVYTEVMQMIQQKSGCTREINPTDKLSADLGLDSLTIGEIAVWIHSKCGVFVPQPGRLIVVADVLLAAIGCGQAFAAFKELAPVDEKWFIPEKDTERLQVNITSICQLFLQQAKNTPHRFILADTNQIKSYKDILTAVHAISILIKKYEGDKIGLMLPASIAATTTYFAILFAGKTPVMFNWTIGESLINHGIHLLNVKHIITSSKLIERLEEDGMNFSSINQHFIYLEDIARGLSFYTKMKAAIYARFCKKAPSKEPNIAAILFTSGSETAPKAVPLSQKNILTNLKDVLSVVDIRRSDALLGMLPPFHSFGLVVGMILPMICGLRTAYHSSPLEATILVQLVQRFKLSLLVATPTFIAGMFRAVQAAALQSVRLIVTGAEACHESLRKQVKNYSNSINMIEGYGITECSPILSVDTVENTNPGTIGKPLPSVEWTLVNPEDQTQIADGINKPGQLLVRGDSIFDGYIGDVQSPFIELQMKRWYNTGDLITIDPSGKWRFAGRKKRFVKLGGEMISLPAIEAALEATYPPKQSKDGKHFAPTIAIIAVEKEDTKIVLFETENIDAEHANQVIRDAGLSGLHRIHNIIEVKEIPLLGTGKINYRELQAMIEGVYELRRRIDASV